MTHAVTLVPVPVPGYVTSPVRPTLKAVVTCPFTGEIRSLAKRNRARNATNERPKFDTKPAP